MPPTSRTRILYLSYFSTPAGQRTIYKLIRSQRARTILELGVGVGQRAWRMIQVASRYHAVERVSFTGIDKFEGRVSCDGPGVTLKMAHRLLQGTGAQVRLIPGDPFSGLSREANAIGQVDLLVISPRHDPQSLARAWFYVPRLLHEGSLVLLESLLPGGRITLRPVPRNEIAALAAAAVVRRAA